MKIRPIQWQHDQQRLLDFDASYATDKVLLPIAEGLSFTLIEHNLAHAFHKRYDFTDLESDIDEADLAIALESASGTIEGFATACYGEWNRSLVLSGIYVSPARKGVGLGHQLLDAVQAYARTTPARQLWLETQNFNLPAIRFYQKAGFELCGLDTSLYDPDEVHEGEIALFFRRSL